MKLEREKRGYVKGRAVEKAEKKEWVPYSFVLFFFSFLVPSFLSFVLS